MNTYGPSDVRFVQSVSSVGLLVTEDSDAHQWLIIPIQDAIVVDEHPLLEIILALVLHLDLDQDSSRESFHQTNLEKLVCHARA